MSRFLTKLATRAPVPVFAIAGEGTAEAVRRLRLSPHLELVDSPRAANVLLVAGPIGPALHAAVHAVHDQMSRPRLTARWDFGGETGAELPASVVIPGGADPVAQILAAHGELLEGGRMGEEAEAADVDANPWRGMGPYGQGGTGMTGGVPYGRPMTDRAPDRDGLELDQLALRVGPFFPALPSGMVLAVKLQGDVVQEASVEDNPFLSESPRAGSPAGDGPFERALTEPVAIAELELARARHHLGWLSEALRLQGLDALGLRALRLASHLSVDDGPALARLSSMVRRSRVLTWSTGAIGILGQAMVAGRGVGVVARAAGLPEDARSLDPAYQAVGFEPVMQRNGDVRARWLQHLDEVTQALELARRAGDTHTTTTGVVEGPRGPLSAAGAYPSAAVLGLLGELLVGLEWGDAVATIASLDIDMGEAARRVADRAGA